ncbi:MAG: Ig-like domain-containing protein [Bryobacteraceae bacterium]
MSKQNLTLAVGVCLAASVAAFGQPGVGYVFQLPGQSSTSGQIYGYPYAANPLIAAVSALGPAGTYQIVAKPDGTGYYVAGETLQIANSAFTSFTTINGISSAPTAVAASPDGKYAVVGAGSVYILSASTGSILLTANTGGPIVGIAISQDSKYAYVLTNAFTDSTVTQFNLVTQTKVTTSLAPLGGNASSIAISPLGLLYAAVQNRLYEINPVTMAFTTNGPSGNGILSLNATPGPLHFTPDGTTLYFANTTSNVTGPSIYQITLSNLSAASFPQVVTTTPPLLSDVLVAGNGRVFGISSSTTTLYDVATSPLGMTVSDSIGTASAQAQHVVAAVLSTELPSALYLYLQVQTSAQTSLYRVTLSNNTSSTPIAASASGGVLEFVGVPPNTGAGSFLTFNATQTVAQGATSLPLVAQVLDTTGRPIFDLPVTFTASASSGIVINTPAPTTNANGFVETTIVAPKAQGTYTVTLTAGTANTSYTITVPGTGGSTGTGPTGVTQVFIVTGDGELVAANSTTFEDPLTVLVKDVNGNPLNGVAVSFSVTSGTGVVGDPQTTTDKLGNASAVFVGLNPALNGPFEVDTVVASTPYGSVTFYEIEYPIVIAGSSAASFPPQVLLLAPTPQNNYTISVPEGAVATNAVTASITVAPGLPGSLTPIPDVGIRIVDPNNFPASSPYASCQGNSLSDNSGTAHCNLVATCGSALGIPRAVYFGVGDQQYFPGTVIVTQGVAQTLTIVSGNNQTGSAGQALPAALLATVTDACGNAISGAPVTWTVTQGSATLSNVVSTSTSTGAVSANVTFGTAAGQVQVTVSLGTSSIATFSLTSQAVASTMTIVSGNNQTATIGAAFTQPLTVQIVDANGNPVTGATVSFAVSSGNVTITPTSAVTNAQGQASTAATATQTPGTIIITASYASVSASFTLTALAVGPQLTATAFTNAASFQPGLVPCGLATATGAGLAPNITGTVSGASFFGPLPTVLDGLSLTVNGTPAPIYQLSNSNGKQQVTFQTPCEAAVGNNGVVQVNLNGAVSTVQGVSILAAQPGIFFYTAADGNSYGQVIDSTGNYVTAANPAKLGGSYYMIATGLGQLTPATATDSVGVNGQNVLDQVIVGVSNAGVPVFTSYYQPGEVGVYVVGFTIPTNLTLLTTNGNDQPLALAVVVNGQTIFGNPVFIPVVQ